MKVVIRIKKYETKSQAEWRYFRMAMFGESKYTPQQVYKAMKDPRKRAEARRWMNGPTEKQKRESEARQRNLAAPMGNDLKKHYDAMVNSSGFMSNDGYN